MVLYLWRHGEAEKDSQSGRDEDRCLAPEGRNDLVDVADFLFFQKNNEKPQKIFSSPLVRAKESAETLQGFLGCPEGLEVLPELRAGAVLKDLVLALEPKLKGLAAAAFVGHMPDLGQLAVYLTGSNVVPDLKTGGLLKIDLPSFTEPFKARLVLSLNPQDLSR